MSSTAPGVTCCAVLAVRNEEYHVRRVLSDCAQQGIDVVLIDHDSTDGTRRVCEEFFGRCLVGVKRLPWLGAFDLTAQLAAKRSVISGLPHQWVIHADADELLQSPLEGESLREGITRAHHGGYDAINFEEFVFLPPPGLEPDPLRCADRFLDYYFYAPRANRLMRAWRRDRGLTNAGSGGHTLEGDVKLFPENFVLRHYIVQSESHAREKYCGRNFSRQDVAKGWHARRLAISPERLRLPPQDLLMRLDHPHSKRFDRSSPRTTHYWDW